MPSEPVADAVRVEPSQLPLLLAVVVQHEPSQEQSGPSGLDVRLEPYQSPFELVEAGQLGPAQVPFVLAEVEAGRKNPSSSFGLAVVDLALVDPSTSSAAAASSSAVVVAADVAAVEGSS